MNRAQKERHETLLRTRGYLVEFRDRLGDVNQSRARGSLDSVLDDVEQFAGYQSQARTEVCSRAVLREDLREALRLEHMLPIAAIARARLSDSPLLFKLQAPRKNVDDATLIAAGDGMAEAAVRYREVFVAQHLGEDFIDDLRTAVDALRNVIVDREAMRVRRRLTTCAIRERLNDGSKLVRILDGLVMKHIRRHPELLAAWVTAKRHRARPGGRGATQESPLSLMPAVSRHVDPADKGSLTR